MNFSNNELIKTNDSMMLDLLKPDGERRKTYESAPLNYKKMNSRRYSALLVNERNS
jgi:hypothetical protein